MRRPDGVTMTAIWFFMNSAFALLGLGGMFIGLIGVWTGGDAEGIIFGTLGMFIGILAIASYGIANAVTGIGLWRLRDWSRGAAKVLAIVQLLLVPIGTVIGIAILVYLARNDNARSAFEAPRTA